MAISVVMPALEMAQETGKLLAWRKKEGERVSKGEPLLEIETDKAVVEVEAPGDGMLAGITAEVGAVIPVGETIAWLVAPGEKPPSQAATSASPARAVGGGMQQPGGASAIPVAAKMAAGQQMSPKARRLAKELGVDIAQMRGTGPDGVITAEDVQKYADSNDTGVVPAITPSAKASAAEAQPLSQVARLMAERTTQSWTSVPHFFLVREADASELIAAQKQMSETAMAKRSAAPTITDLLIALLAKTLAKHPRMNASWTGDGIRSNPDINISVAMAMKDRVVGAVIHKANTLSVTEISVQRHELTSAQEGDGFGPRTFPAERSR